MKELKHPYTKYQKTEIWELINNALDDLINNQDIKLTTKKDYVVGYICQSIDSEFKSTEKVKIVNI